MDWRLEAWIRENVPEQDKLSRDAVIILMKQCWEEARKSQRSDRANQDHEDRYGPDI